MCFCLKDRRKVERESRNLRNVFTKIDFDVQMELANEQLQNQGYHHSLRIVHPSVLKSGSVVVGYTPCLEEQVGNRNFICNRPE